jgi:D-alanyl-D-alanine carboxypeptidase
MSLAAGLALFPAAGRAIPGTGHDRLIDAVDLDGAPGLSLAVVRAGQTLALGGKGRKGPGDAGVPDADTIFEIGSLTKTFTASLIFELEAEGRLDTGAPVGTYLPDLPEPWQRLPLDLLLSHTSGLPEYLDAGNFLALMPRDLKPSELVKIAAAKPFTFDPGTRHAYNNTGFVLLGMVAEAVAKRPYWDQLTTRFFAPAGMPRTGPRSRIRQVRNRAAGRFWDGSAWNDHPPISAPGSTFSAGGLVSTARDLARWAAALDGDKLLGARSRARMWRPAQLKDGAPAGWGYGWVIDEAGGHRIASHGGGTAVFSCWLRRDIDARLTTIVLTNQNGRADPLSMTQQLLAGLAAR